MKRSTLYIVVIALLSSCSLFRKAAKLTRVDSTSVAVPVYYSIQRDSVVTSFRYDTLHTVIVEKQGRAKVTIQKIDSTIYVESTCEPIIIRDTLYVNVGNKQVYEKELTFWQKVRDFVQTWLLVAIFGLILWRAVRGR